MNSNTPDEMWKQKLDPKSYDVLRKGGTEQSFTGIYWDEHSDGIYRCKGCAEPLFSSEDKFDSGTGWPSFAKAVDDSAVTLHEDTKFFMKRVEVCCAKCDGHLGHLFHDGPRDKGGLRYCMNSCSLDLEKAH